MAVLVRESMLRVLVPVAVPWPVVRLKSEIISTIERNVTA